MDDKESLKLSTREAEMVLSSLGFVNKTKRSRDREWRGPGLCHHGKNDAGFSYRYDKGVAVCWTDRCFGEGTDIYGVVSHMNNVNFFHAKRYVENIIGRKLNDSFEERSQNYYDNLMAHIKAIHEQVREVEERNSKKEQIIYSDEVWKLYARNKHPYWASRGFSKDTVEFFGAGYNPENNRVTVPIFDYIDGESSFVAMKQRIASDDPSLITDSNPKYLHDSYNAGQVLFNLQNAIAAYSDPRIKRHLRFPGLILIEGNFDVMMSHQLGNPNSAGTGSNFLTHDQAMLIERYFENCLIIPDQDRKVDEKGKSIWRGGRLVESAKRELGHTVNLYVGNTGSVKDIGSLGGWEHGADYLACVIDAARRI